MKNRVSKIRNAGETLLEAIVAVSVIMIMLSPASALYISSTKNIAIDRNELVAAMLAEEGLEMVRNVRDTNMLKFAPKAQSCWDTVPGAAITLDTCDINSNKISDKIQNLRGNALLPAWFSIGIDPIPANLPVMLSPASDKALEAVAPLEQYRLWLNEDPRPSNALCAVGALICHKDFRDDTHMYVTVQKGTPTIFYRAVKIKYLDVTKEKMSVESSVVYPRGRDMKIVKRATVFTNRPIAE